MPAERRFKVPACRIVERPNFTYTKPCAPCPSMRLPLDPFTVDILSWPDGTEGREDFACAWRKHGNCHGWARLLRNPCYNQSEVTVALTAAPLP